MSSPHYSLCSLSREKYPKGLGHQRKALVLLHLGSSSHSINKLYPLGCKILIVVLRQLSHEHVACYLPRLLTQTSPVLTFEFFGNAVDDACQLASVHHGQG